MPHHVPMQSVQSSCVEAIGYDENRRALYLRYVGGATYKYSAVRPNDYCELMQAESKGRYVNKRIKPYYDAQRIDNP